MPTYLNFELQISTFGNQYRVQVTASPVNETPSAIFTFPYEPDVLQRILLVLSGERNFRGATRQEIARQFGEKLFETIFKPEIAATYRASRDVATAQNDELRIRLNLARAGRLANLPWEFLRDPDVDYLALSRSTPIVRYANKYVQLDRFDAQLPLRILVMISAPDDLPAVDEALERANLEAAVEGLSGLVEIEYLEDASLRALQRILREKDFDAFHYIGHSTFNAETGVGYLALEDPINHEKTNLVRGEALARELYEEPNIRLVVLNSCQGAQADTRDPFSGVASSLVQRGIPAVVAQQFEITDKAAIAFSEEFYRAVAGGYPIEAAVSEARRAILSVTNSVEWATPVLFLHGDDSQKIFNFPREGERIQQPSERTRVIRVFASLVTALIVLFIAGYALLTSGESSSATAAPATATPIPDVDLVVRDVRLSPSNPQPGEFAAIFVDIENRGSDPAPDFTYEWQASLFDPESVVEVRVEGLAPGGILRDSFPYRFGWWGSFISDTRVDSDNEIIESSEQNNRPRPIVTNNAAPFIIDLSEPRPDGSFVRQNQPVPPNTYVPWGFTLDAVSDDPSCEAVVPWYKFVGISRIALGTGLPDDPNQCVDATLVITFLERADNNLAGVSTIEVDFVGRGGELVLETFSDRAATVPIASERGSAGATLLNPSQVGVFARILSARISPMDTSLQVTRLILTAP